MTSNLVIGSDGFVGKPLCAYLSQLGEIVIPFDIKRDASEDARIAKLPLDGVDRNYFLAWEVGGSKYLSREDIQFLQLDSNLRIMLNIFPQLQTVKVPFLFVSSQLAEEYDTAYGATKRLGEVWSHLLGGVRARLWNVYGAYEPASERSHVVADFMWQALTRGEIRMLTTGSEMRQFVYIDDVCRAFHHMIDMRVDGVYDITSFEWVSVRTVADTIATLTGATVIPGDRLGSTPITPMRGKVKGWEPSVSLRHGLEQTLALFKSKPIII